ncbi:MAG: transporter substrate-binding domain-containing protein [Clostridiales bacterium]|nr:transporter substrate-binding domain-containing protein [Clostridiales bacterium]
MKKLTSILLAAVMALSLVSCGSNQEEAANNNDGVLRVGMECNYAPYNWSQANDSNGAVPISNVDNMYTNGYDVQVAKKIAEALGKNLEIYSYEWDSLIPGVQSGKLDMIIAGMSPTAERKEKIDFSNNYYTSNLVIVTKKDGLSDVKTLADLKDKKIAAQSGTFHLQALTEQTQAQINELADFSTMFIALGAGTIDGYVAEEPTAMSVCEDPAYGYVAFENNKTGFSVADDDVSIAVGVKKGSELKEQINGALEGFDEDAQRELMSEMVKIAPSEE